MNARLTSKLRVDALVRSVQAAGGFAVVAHKGDQISGSVIVQMLERGRFMGLAERQTDFDGRASLVPCGPAEGAQDVEITDYLTKRLRSDPDLWVVELDVAQAQRFAAEILTLG